MGKQKRIYYDTYYFLIIVIAFTGTYVVINIILQSIFGSPDWVVYGTWIVGIFAATVMLTRLMPIILITDGKNVTLIGIPWVYKFNRDMLEEVIVECCGILFKPKEEYKRKFKFVPKYPSEPYLGYKAINFLNYRGVGALIEAMKPITGTHINWDKLNPKWRKYLEEKLYGDAE